MPIPLALRRLLRPFKRPLLALAQLPRQLLRGFGYELVRLPAPLRSDQLWEPWLAHLKQKAPLRTVFDIGANRGQTIGWFRPYMPDARFYAFEPFAPAYRDLATATAADQRVKIFQTALGDAAGSATLYENSVDTTNSLLPNSTVIADYAPPHMVIPRGEYQVPVERLDDFCKREGVTHIDLLKLDAQGYELKILQGAGDMLRPDVIRAVYIEILFVDYYKGQAWGGELIEFLRERGYRFWGLAAVAYDPQRGWQWADAMFCAD